MTCPRMRIFGTVSVVRQIWTVVHSRSGIALIWSTNRLSACRSNGKFIQQPPDAEMFLRIFFYDLHLFVDFFSSRGLSSASCTMACLGSDDRKMDRRVSQRGGSFRSRLFSIRRKWVCRPIVCLRRTNTPSSFSVRQISPYSRPSVICHACSTQKRKKSES